MAAASPVPMQMRQGRAGLYTEESVIGMHDRTITDDQTTVDVTSPIGDADGDAVGAVVFE
jgi:hypothetical protein